MNREDWLATLKNGVRVTVENISTGEQSLGKVSHVYNDTFFVGRKLFRSNGESADPSGFRVLPCNQKVSDDTQRRKALKKIKSFSWVRTNLSTETIVAIAAMLPEQKNKGGANGPR